MNETKKAQENTSVLSYEAGKLLPYGIHATKTGVNVSVAIPDGASCTLLIYRHGEDKPCVRVPMEQGRRLGDVCGVKLNLPPESTFDYNFEINGEITPYKYAGRITGRENFGIPEDLENPVARCVYSGKSYDWEDDTPPDIPMHEVIAYSLHVRGFTKDRTSKVRKKGTFAGIIEKLPYLQSLGINQIELMPAYEFEEVQTKDASCPGTGAKLNYWGYGPAFFFAPKASFAAGEDPCREMKDLVKACHKAGMELIMEFYFPFGTGGHLVLDCIRHWAIEYHVDGFHLNAESVPMNEIVTDPLLKGVKIYASNFDQCDIRKNTHLAICHDGFLQTSRRLLKSDEDQLQPFLDHTIAHPEGLSVINSIAGHNGFTLRDLVSYDQKHNEANGEDNRDGSDYNFSWNCGEEGATRKKKVLSLRKRQMKNALAMLYLSQGIPMLLAGDEMGNSQEGNNNAWCLDNEISWVQWDRPAFQEIRTFVQKLIAFRKAHPILHSARPLRMMDVSGCGFPDVSFHGSNVWFAELNNYNRHVGIMYCDAKISEPKAEKVKAISYDFIYVAYNFHWMPHEFALPRLPKRMKWCLVLDTEASKEQNLETDECKAPLENQQTIEVPGRCVWILTGVEEHESK